MNILIDLFMAAGFMAIALTDCIKRHKKPRIKDKKPKTEIAIKAENDLHELNEFRKKAGL